MEGRAIKYTLTLLVEFGIVVYTMRAFAGPATQMEMMRMKASWNRQPTWCGH